jgi:hypothetical protein
LALHTSEKTAMGREKLHIQRANQAVGADIVVGGFDLLLHLAQQVLQINQLGLPDCQRALLFVLDLLPLPEDPFKTENKFRHGLIDG